MKFLNEIADNYTAIEVVVNNDEFGKKVREFYNASKWLNVVLITIITMLGLYGNLMSIKIFSKSYMKKNKKKISFFFSSSHTVIVLCSCFTMLILHLDHGLI